MAKLIQVNLTLYLEMLKILIHKVLQQINIRIEKKLNF